jgi:predicted membrane protein
MNHAMGIHVNSIHPMSVPGQNMRFMNTSSWRVIRRLMEVLSGTIAWALIGAIGGSLYGALCGSISAILHQNIGKVFYYAMIFGVFGTGIGAILGVVIKLVGGKKG